MSLVACLTNLIAIPIVIGMTNKNTYSHQAVLPIGEAARRLGVSIATVRNWERDGKISSFRTPGGQRRFQLADVEALTAPALAGSPQAVA